MQTPAAKVLLGRNNQWGSKQKVYISTDCLEIQESEGASLLMRSGNVLRKRLYFEDVLLVTYHRTYGFFFLGLFGGLFLLFSGAGAVIYFITSEPLPALMSILLYGVPCLIVFILRMIFQKDIITVYGKRTKAELSFDFRKARAREVFNQICELVRHKQEALAARIQAETLSSMPVEVFPQPPGTDRLDSVQESF